MVHQGPRWFMPKHGFLQLVLLNYSQIKPFIFAICSHIGLIMDVMFGTVVGLAANCPQLD